MQGRRDCDAVFAIAALCGGGLSMAIFWATTSANGARRFFITDREARGALNAGEWIEREIIDDIDARELAAKWLNYSEGQRRRAIQRERAKSAEAKRGEVARAWATKRAKREAAANLGGGESELAKR